MDTELNARGIVIGERYRVAGTLRRTGVIEAIDLDADRGSAACRLVGVPGDAAAVDAWEDAWRAAQVPARLPHLLEVVTDHDGAAWAALSAAEATTPLLPGDARRQAYAIGVALAEAGLDVGDITSAMLVANNRGQLIVDGIPFRGGDGSPRAAAEQLVALLPPDHEDPVEPDWVEVPVAPVARRRQTSRSRRRLLVPGAIGLVLVAALVALLLPARSTGTTGTGESIEAPPADVLLGDAAYRVIAAEPQQTVTITVEARPAQAQRSQRTTVIVDQTVSQAGSEPVPDSAAAGMPAIEAPRLPLAESTLGVPLPVDSGATDLPLGN